MNLVSLLLNGLTLATILMIVALGLAIIFGLMNVINLAHGEFVTIGAYTLALVQALGGSYWLALLLAPIVGGLLGLALERSLIRFLYRRPISAILATWGLSLVIQQLIQLAFGAAPRRVDSPIDGSILILGESYPAYRLFLIVVAALVVAACAIGFKYTRFGLDLRAVIQNRSVAAAMGINTERVYAAAFALGVAMAALAGVLIAPLTVVIAQMGLNYLARSFFVVILGGAGSIGGVAASSVFVGGLETVLNYQIPVTVSQALVLVIAILIIRFRPQGLLPA
ncbi:MAG: branched-chain amino acid ABC transporter permease [Alphaproteobacteria bacterium]|nr:MAG: branched-chain amino acid ABC transporter permease [Alphaproteobacteria bacterium]